MYRFIFNSSLKSALSCATGLVLMTGSALAHHPASESFDVSGSIDTAPADGSFTLPDFDSTLGTLETVTLTLKLTDTSSIQVFNTSSTSQDFQNASLALQGTLSGPGLVLAPSINSVLGSGTAQPGLNTFSLNPATQTATGKADSNSLNLWVDQPDGVINFSFDKGNPTFQGTDVGGDNLLFGGTFTGEGDVSVKYTYLTSCPPLSTPEPAGHLFTMLAAGAMAVLALGRSRLIRS